MGGKSYWCDYCECFMKNDINVRNNHNIGTSHKIAKANYLQRFKDPQQIIGEEKIKILCKRILNNQECTFGFFCRFSHYTSEEINNLQMIVDRNQCKKEKYASKTATLPWNTTKSRKQLPQPTPPSLQPMDFGLITDSCFQNQWG